LTVSADILIANLALSAIGARASIASFTEQSTEAQTINLHYESVRNEALQCAHWNFARRQATLNLLLDATQGQTVPSPWSYEYAYPADCIAFRYMLPCVSGLPPVPFLVSGGTDANGNDIRVLLSNEPQAVGVYTYLCRNPSLWDPLFRQLLTHLLASRIAIPISGDKGIAQQQFSVARDLSEQAKTRNGDEGITVQDSMPDWITVRGDFCYQSSVFCHQPQTLQF
jgi:hypothetical protein